LVVFVFVFVFVFVLVFATWSGALLVATDEACDCSSALRWARVTLSGLPETPGLCGYSRPAAARLHATSRPEATAASRPRERREKQSLGPESAASVVEVPIVGRAAFAAAVGRRDVRQQLRPAREIGTFISVAP